MSPSSQYALIYSHFIYERLLGRAEMIGLAMLFRALVDYHLVIHLMIISIPPPF